MLLWHGRNDLAEIAERARPSRGVSRAHKRIRVRWKDPDGTMPAGDEGMTAKMMTKIIVLCGVVLMLAGCADPVWSCSGNGGANHNSGGLCAGRIPLSW